MKDAILYIHHVGDGGGSSNSLLNMVSKSARSFEKILFVPRGQYKDKYLEAFDRVYFSLGIPQFDNTRFGQYKKLRWLILLREIFYFFTAAPLLIFLLLKNSKRIKIVHFNEITLFPLVYLVSIFNFKIVIHVRSNQAANLRSKLIFKFVQRVAKIVAIDKFVANTIPGFAQFQIIQNFPKVDSKTAKSFIPKHSRDHKINFISLGGDEFLKGIDLTLLALKKVADTKKFNFELNIYGLNQNFGVRKRIKMILSREERFSIAVVNKLKSMPWVKIHPYENNLEMIYGSADLILFTSRHNAPGRPLFEGAFHGVPSLFCLEDEFNDGEYNKYAYVCQPNVEEIHKEIMNFLTNTARRELIMKQGTSELIKSHSPTRNIKKLDELYKKLQLGVT